MVDPRAQENTQSVWSCLPPVTRLGPTTWRSETHAFTEALLVREGVYRIDGGEAVAHAIRILADAYPDRALVALNVVFSREGRHELPTDYALHTLHAGRNYAFANVEATQPDRGVQAHMQAVLAAPSEGLSHQGATAPSVDFAGAVDDMGELLPVPVQVAGGRTLGDPAPGDVDVQLRFALPLTLRDRADVQAYLAEVADHSLTAPVFRPHAGVGYRTKKRFYTAPTGLQLRYWADIEPASVVTMIATSPVMTNGFGFAEARAFDAEGRLVFTSAMDVVVRAAD